MNPPFLDFSHLREHCDAAGYAPRFHGTGFTQLYISNASRLHVWHPDLEGWVVNGAIHDHSWHMQSRVLLGMVRHFVYRHQPYLDGAMALYQPGQGKDAPLQKIVWSECQMAPTGRNFFAAGSSYEFPPRQFHQSGAFGISATLITKSRGDGNPPRIAARQDEAPDHAFDRQPSQREMWGVIEEAFSLWRK